MIYLLVVIYLGAVMLLHDFGQLRVGRLFNFWCALLILICLSGFRYKVGGDTHNYMYAHEFLPSLAEFGSSEVDFEKLQPFWLLLSALAKSISDEFFVVQFLHAILLNAIIFNYIRKNTAYPFTAIFFYAVAVYPYFNFEILRESLAIAVFLLAVPYFNSGKWLQYYVLIACAILFHVSAVFLLFLPLVRRIKLGFLSATVLFFVCAALNSLVLDWLQSGPALFSILANSEAYSEYTYTIFGLLALFLFYVLYPAVVVKASKMFPSALSGDLNLINKGLLIGAITPLLFIFFRFFNYFSILFLVAVVEVVHSILRDRRTRRIRGELFVVLFTVLLVFYTGRYTRDMSEYVEGARWYNKWYPYYSIFDMNTDPLREQLVEAEFSR